MGKSILIVDDSSIMRKMIKETLKTAGHDVIGEAKNGDDAVALYKTLKPDLVTMDITMRGMDGFEAARLSFGLDAWRAAALPVEVPQSEFMRPGTVPFVIPRGICEMNEPAEVYR